MSSGGDARLGGAVGAKPFVPGGSAAAAAPPAAVAAKPFVPSLSNVAAAPFVPSGGAAAASAAPSGALRGIDAKPFVPGGGGGGAAAAAPAAPHANLPDDDDAALGMSSGAAPRQALEAQAAELLRALRPSAPAAAPARPPSRPGSQQQQPYGGGRGGGRSSGAANGAGRGAGRSFPGAGRPAIAAHALAPGRAQAAAQFAPAALLDAARERAYLAAAALTPEDAAAAGLPATIAQYHSLVPLEDPAPAAARARPPLGGRSLVLKGVHAGDGGAYALRRLDGHRFVPTAELLEAAEAAVAAWAPVANHPGVAGLREAFVSDELAGAPALFLAYDYHPGAATLEAVHLAPPAAGGAPAPEATLWSYLAQLLAALRAAHAAGLALRPAALHSSKVLLAAPGRVRLAAAGAADALAGAPPADLAAAQRADLAALGRLLLELGCGAAPPALDALAERGASRDLVRALAGLLAAAEGSGFASAEAAAAALGGRLLAALDAAHVAADAATEALGREAENGRLLRLAVKLAMVCERAEVGGDTRWSETGDRYLLQLFRDFAFHQVDSAGRPVVDWGWVVEALNKADAGAGERVLLLSRDGASMLVVSYADVRRCLAASYDQLKAAAAAAAPAAGGGAGGSGDAPWRQY